MNDTERRNDRQLALIKEFASICIAASIEFWLRGGWAMDFFLGRVTRAHHDVDVFVWSNDAITLMERLRQAGFEEMGGAPPEEQRNVARHGEELQIVLLDSNQRGEIVLAGGRFGRSGEQFLHELPDRLAQRAELWHLVLGPPYPVGIGGYLVQAERPDGSAAVLKLSPTGSEQARANQLEVLMLRRWSGQGAVMDSGA